MSASDKLAERIARAFHEGLLKDPDCVAWTWDELSDRHRAWKIAAAQEVINQLGLRPEELLQRLEVAPKGQGYTCGHPWQYDP